MLPFFCAGEAFLEKKPEEKFRSLRGLIAYVHCFHRVPGQIRRATKHQSAGMNALWLPLVEGCPLRGLTFTAKLATPCAALYHGLTQPQHSHSTATTQPQHSCSTAAAQSQHSCSTATAQLQHSHSTATAQPQHSCSTVTAGTHVWTQSHHRDTSHLGGVSGQVGRVWGVMKAPAGHTVLRPELSRLSGTGVPLTF